MTGEAELARRKLGTKLGLPGMYAYMLVIWVSRCCERVSCPWEGLCESKGECVECDGGCDDRKGLKGGMREGRTIGVQPGRTSPYGCT